MRENHYLDDGAYSAVQTIIEMVRQTLSGRSKDIGAAILADLTEPVESREYRLKVRVARYCPPFDVCKLRKCAAYT